MSQLETQMRYRDREMVPLFLVRAMFALMAASLLIVAYAQLSGTPNTGVLQTAPAVAERSILITNTGDRTGTYEVTDAETGQHLAMSSDHMGGFYGVIGRVFERERFVHRVDGNPPVTVVRRENGNTAILDASTGLEVELIGYGADNVAAFARLIDQ